jgi:hypothetical protein
MITTLQSAARQLRTWIALSVIALAFVGNTFAQDPVNLIRNGQFTSNLNSWSTYIADWDGVGATIASTDGEASITKISNAGRQVWHIQLLQDLTAGQIDSIVVGATYAISFDARSSENGRQLRVYFGENGESEFLKELRIANFQLTTEMETYTMKFFVPETFANMKLSFEMGLSNASVFIDNVALFETEADGIELPVTFDDSSLDYKLTDFGGNASDIIEDPTNSENKVVRSIKTSAAELWAGTTVNEPDGFAAPIPFTAETTTMSVRVWSPEADLPVRLKVENSGNPTITVETETRTTVAGEWETMVFDFSNQAAGTAELNLDNSYNKASIFFNFGTTGGQAGELTFYWDDVAFGGDAGATPPPVPVGFVASNMIGENPVALGQVFLAAGPNNVAQEDIVYRLFYALTSANLEDPKNGTEYVFGNTAGDGEGNNPFGFVLGGLQPSTSYTFWLYQYNTADELFSESPATAVTLSGGDAPAIPAAPVGFVAFNTIGETPVGNGEVFLAAGPNDVEQENIVYRLFYALTSANLSDPKQGTEHTFGTIDGDGGGNAAFGFVLGGLEPGTSYTFWLYQFNTASQTFSTNAGVATVVSGGTSTNLGEDGSLLPLDYALGQNYPNPFNPSTSIQFALPESGQVQIDVFNMIGRRVMSVVNGTMSAGYHVVTLDASPLSSGLYIYRLKAGNVVLTQKMTLVK